MQRHEPSEPSGRRQAFRRLAPFFAFAVVFAGCAGKPTIVSDCPAPNIEEEDDLEEWLCPDHNQDGACDTPGRPAKAWVSRVLGHIYDLELREVRGEPDPR